MDQEQNQMQAAPQLCRNGCGFYGSPSFDGLCSKCHKDIAKNQADKAKQDKQASGTAAGLSQVLQETSAALLAASTSTSTAQPTVSVLPASSGAPVSAATAATTATPAAPVVAVSAATTSAASAATAVPVPITEGCPEPEGTPCIQDGDATASPAEPPGKKKKSRCDVCRKKVGLTGFTCRCDGLFCSLHRYSDKHDCSFDYRVHGQQEIRKNNPVIVGEKVNKI